VSTCQNTQWQDTFYFPITTNSKCFCLNCPVHRWFPTREEFPLCSKVTSTCHLSHRANDVLTLSATLLNLCHRGGMKSSKLSEGRNASKQVGKHCYTWSQCQLIATCKWNAFTMADLFLSYMCLTCSDLLVALKKAISERIQIKTHIVTSLRINFDIVTSCLINVKRVNNRPHNEPHPGTNLGVFMTANTTRTGRDTPWPKRSVTKSVTSLISRK